MSTQAAILLGIVTLIIGFYLNKYANYQSNQKLLAELRKELQALNIAGQTGRGTPEMQIQKQRLEAQIQILQR